MAAEVPSSALDRLHGRGAAYRDTLRNAASANRDGRVSLDAALSAVTGLETWVEHWYPGARESKELDELRAGFNLRWEADQRAIKRWQKAHPGKELTWPDHADLVVWLQEQLEAATPAAPAAPAAGLDEEWSALRNGLSKAHIASDIDAALATARPRIEAAVLATPAAGLREALVTILALVETMDPNTPLLAPYRQEVEQVAPATPAAPAAGLIEPLDDALHALYGGDIAGAKLAVQVARERAALASPPPRPLRVTA